MPKDEPKQPDKVVRRRDYCAFEPFVEAVNSAGINDVAGYRHLRARRQDLRLPPSPEAAYPGRFNGWDQFRPALRELRETHAAERAAGLVRPKRRRGRRGGSGVETRSPEQVLEQRYKDYCRECDRTGKTPLTMGERFKSQS